MWQSYVALGLMFAAGAGVSMIWAGPLARAFLAGVYLCAFVGLVAFSLVLDGSHLRRMGADAERWTSAELRKLKGWWVLDAVEFADGDVDHVAVGPGVVLAVETKWTSRPVTIDERGVHGLWCDALGQVRWSARRTRSLLASRGVQVEVIPVLVLWGSGVSRIDGGYQRIGDVRVLVGAQGKQWRERLVHAGSGQPVEGAREVLEDYVHRFDAQRSGKGRRVAQPQRRAETALPGRGRQVPGRSNRRTVPRAVSSPQRDDAAAPSSQRPVPTSGDALQTSSGDPRRHMGMANELENGPGGAVVASGV